MKNLIIIISSFLLIQISVFAQDVMNNLPDNSIDLEEFQELDYYRGDTVILIDSTINISYYTGSGIPSSKTWYKERDAQGRKFININYGWDNLNNKYFPTTTDSILYYSDNSMKEKYTKTYDRIMNNWKLSAYSSFNAKALPLIQETLNWDATIGQYYLGSQVISNYLADTLLISEQTNNYDTATAGWLNKSLIEIVRNDFGDVITEKSKIYDESTNDWKTIAKIEYVRNENRIIIKKITSNFDTTQNLLVYVDMHEYFLDESENDTLVAFSTWSIEENLWKLKSKNQRVFEEGHRVILDVGSVWSDELESWHFTFKTEYNYTVYGDQDTVSHYKWYLEYGFWYGTGRQMRFYDENRVLIEVINQDYDLVYEYWYNVSRVMWEYGDGYDIFIVDEWENNAWYGRTRAVNTYNEQGQLVLQMGNWFGTVETGWDIIERTIITYGEHGERLILQYDHNYHNAGWELEHITNYYYSEYVLPNSVTENLQLDFNVFPNPSKGIVSVSLPETSGKTAKLSVFDINGRLIKSTELNDKSSVIDLYDLNKGIYFFNISNGLLNGTKKLIIN